MKIVYYFIQKAQFRYFFIFTLCFLGLMLATVTVYANDNKPDSSFVHTVLKSEKQDELTSETASSNTFELKEVKEQFLQMQSTLMRSNYQLHFYIEDNLLSSNESNSFLYEHHYFNGEEQARLTSLEGVPKEIVLNKKVVSYFQSNVPSFSLSGRYIMEAFPEILYADFDKLVKYYQFKEVGKSRVANRSTHLIQITPKEKDRYGYLIWLDLKTNLPLRIDLFGLNSQMMQQIKVVHFSEQLNVEQFTNYIENLQFPNEKLEESSEIESTSLKWKSNWLPKGFVLKSTSNFYYGAQEMNSKHYSDGAFSFSVTVSSDVKEKTQTMNIEGITSVYTITKDGKNIVVIGALPLSTLKKIADNLSF